MLRSWEDIEKEAEWDTILLGNGFSQQVWKEFAYPSLYEVSIIDDAPILTQQHQAIFDSLHTRNFEEVLKSLDQSRKLAKILNLDATEYETAHGQIKSALLTAVQKTHIDKREMRPGTPEKIADHLSAYRRIFTTNYDLLIYWSINSRQRQFEDLFRRPDGNLVFVPEIDSDDPDGVATVYYLHGALHLAHNSENQLTKVSSGGSFNILRTLENQSITPLVVTEGSSQYKQRAISSSDYLFHCLEKLKSQSSPLVVFGHSLDESDSHICEAIKKNCREMPIAISILAGEANGIQVRTSLLRRMFPDQELHFFDAATHPLGSENLAARTLMELAVETFGSLPVALPPGALPYPTE